MRIIRQSILIVMLCLSAITAQSKEKAEKPTDVITSRVKTLHIADEVEALGTLHANESVELTSTVVEVITGVQFQDGQRVEKGDLLIEMDYAEEMAELAEEQSRYDEAKRQVDRLKPLVSRGAASESALDQSKREAFTSQARINAIQSRINQRMILAPFDGVVGLRNISVGAVARVGSLLTTIDDDSVMKMDFSVPAVFLSTLKPGIEVLAYTKAYPEQIFNGKIASVDSRVDQVTRSVVVRALVPNDNRLLKPGMLMYIELQKNPRQALMVPEGALVLEAQKHYAWIVIQDGDGFKATKRYVQIGTRQQGKVEITEGLTADQQVVIHGNIKLRPDAPVNILAVQQADEPLEELLTNKTPHMKDK